jgi:threonine/homoserine/homoserine lactone efflux protein
MPHADTLLLFMTAALALNVTPGPDMLYVIARSTGEGRAAGIASALGIALGCLVHIAALALGLSVLLTRVPAAYDVIRFAGAAYLVYLGIRALVSRSELIDTSVQPACPERSRRARSLGVIVLQGCVTNILNPKVALFFLAFIPQFIRVDGWPPAAQIVALGLLFNTSGTIVNVAVAFAASRATRWLRANRRSALYLQRATGAVFVGLGVRLAFARKV